MQIADQCLREGDLTGARTALVEKLRSNPADDGVRMFLFQLLCLVGEWDKARKQLETLAKLSPEARMLSVVYGQAIDAEGVRAEVFAGKVKADILAGGGWAEDLAKALQSEAKGEPDSGSLRGQALDEAPDTPGTIDGTRFEWLADADSRLGPCFETILGGRYGLVAFDAVERIQSEGPRDLRDIVWYPVEIAFRTGQSAAALLPARYPGTEYSEDSSERLGRATNWRKSSSGEVGSGQHLWMLSNGEDRGLLSLRTLTFD